MTPTKFWRLIKHCLISCQNDEIPIVIVNVKYYSFCTRTQQYNVCTTCVLRLRTIRLYNTYPKSLKTWSARNSIVVINGFFFCLINYVCIKGVKLRRHALAEKKTFWSPDSSIQNGFFSHAEQVCFIFEALNCKCLLKPLAKTRLLLRYTYQKIYIYTENSH